MRVFRYIWNDNKTQRDVTFDVTYRMAGEAVQIDSLRPTRVQLYNTDSGEVYRTLPVTTEKGRSILVAALRKATGLTCIEEAIREYRQLIDSAPQLAAV